jgi:hypothetical protein
LENFGKFSWTGRASAGVALEESSFTLAHAEMSITKTINENRIGLSKAFLRVDAENIR